MQVRGPDDATLAGLRRESADLGREAARRMEEGLPWYRELSASDRSWIGLVAQAGINSFISWYSGGEDPAALRADVFGTAPRELTRSISLQHTLDMVRTVVDTVEGHVPQIATPDSEQALREAVLRYSRDVAFAAATVYARAAESRGNWDARLEALILDGVLRGASDGDELRSWAAALNWGEANLVTVLAGPAPGQRPIEETVATLRRAARAGGGDVLIGVQGERLVLVLGHASDPSSLVKHLLPHLGDGPVVTGPTVAGLVHAAGSARTALAGLAAAPGWAGAPRPVAADDLLPERALNGDGAALETLRTRAYEPLVADNSPLLETLAAYLELGGSLEGTARALFVHTNTVRYRLRKVSDVTGWDPTEARSAFVLRVAIVAGRQAPVRTSPDS
ncbi:PucR family transcriptional regulator [Spongisporangium articulatum]|uniref:PucR family transcriptional regulator n=1 Tax=Spongisporangium articulatum TaxID=3362603 RepID=A0ABW8ANU5_9ACTN